MNYESAVGAMLAVTLGAYLRALLIQRTDHRTNKSGLKKAANGEWIAGKTAPWWW